MSVLQYSPTRKGDALAGPFAIASNCVGLGGNVWGALAAWSIHAIPPGSSIHPLRLEMLLFLLAVLTAAAGVGLALAALFRGRGRIGIVLLACLGMHLSLIPYLVSNAVLDHLVTKHGLVME